MARTPPATPACPRPNLQASEGFADWLGAQDCSFALTTCQAGRLFLTGRRPDGRLRAQERLIEQCHGLWCDAQTLWTSGLYALWRFGNDLPTGQQTASGADRLLVPRDGRMTGRIDVYDIAIGIRGKFGGTSGQVPILLSSAFSWLAPLSDTASFRPLWRPPFVTAQVGEDRCHLNGLAMAGTRAACVSLVARSVSLGPAVWGLSAATPRSASRARGGASCSKGSIRTADRPRPQMRQCATFRSSTSTVAGRCTGRVLPIPSANFTTSPSCPACASPRRSAFLANVVRLQPRGQIAGTLPRCDISK